MDCIGSDTTPIELGEGLHLFTEATPNGKRVQILLEELHAVYTLECNIHLIDLEADEQKKAWFMRLNPNGRIPVLLHKTTESTVSIMESAAILQYLSDNFDPDYHFRFSSSNESSQVLQWLFFWHSCTPVHAQARYMNSKKNTAPAPMVEKARSDVLERYATLEIHLSGKYTGQQREFLAGRGQGKYSTADMGAWPHIRSYKSLGFSEEDMRAFPCLLQWIDIISKRPAVQQAIGTKYDSEENPDLVIKSK